MIISLLAGPWALQDIKPGSHLPQPGPYFYYLPAATYRGGGRAQVSSKRRNVATAAPHCGK
jgi:hypothetical protein